MRVLVCGDREWWDRVLVRDRLRTLAKETVIIHGGARGADTIAGEEAEALGLEVVSIPANWDAFGRATGPIRNKQMLVLGPSIVLAFHDDLSRSKGTKNCVDQARKMGISVEVIGHQ